MRAKCSKSPVESSNWRIQCDETVNTTIQMEKRGRKKDYDEHMHHF
jgi:hypothetical protein